MPRTNSAAVVVIGNEILSGRTRDGNIQHIASGLEGVGVRLREVRVVSDDEAAIVAAVNDLRAAHDYVFTTGGVGPTHDDITAASVAQAFGVPFGSNAEAAARLEAYFASRDVEANEARMSMADMPAGAALIDNPVSGAPGFRIENVFVMAGVPQIMQAMFAALLPGLVGGAPMLSRTVSVDLPEGAVAEALEGLQKAYADVEIGSYPDYRRRGFGLNLVLRATDADRLAAAAAELVETLCALGGTPTEESAAA